MSDLSLASVDANARALADLVEAHRAQRCDAIAAEAATQVASLLRTARANARAMARRTFDEARARREVRVASASAEVATRARLAEQHRLRALLDQGMRMLPEVLERRWHDAKQRAAWVAGILDEARRSLPPGGWRVAHPADFTQAERADVERALASPVRFAVNAAMRAGLRIEAPPNVVDGTLEGILADRDAVEALLLVCMAQEGRALAPAEKT